MKFTDLDIGIKYRSNSNNIPHDFMIPVLSIAKTYKRAVGFFSSSSLIDLSVGLFQLAERGGHIQIVCSPRLNDDDLQAINFGYKTKEKVILEALDISLTNPVDTFEEERLNLIATLIVNGTLELKLAFMESDKGINIYHEKIAVLYDEAGNKISFTGSMNETENALVDNFESIVVFCDWKSEQKQYVTEAEQDFESLWNNTTKKIQVVDFPKVIIEKIKSFKKETINYRTDYLQFSSNINNYIIADFLNIPSSIKLKDYQSAAIKNWKMSDYRGIYDMATGTGKTFTALASIVELGKDVDNKLATFIVCPYIHLVGQWEEDIVKWGMNPIIAHSDAPNKKWESKLIDVYKRFRTDGKPFICITSNATFCSEKIQQIINNITEEMNVLLVVDEAHNFGAARQASYLNPIIKYRLALSATIERYMDRTGTEKIFNYFGERCITYSLEEAISEGHLVEYEYHPIYSFLEHDELQKYKYYTKQLKQFLTNENGKIKLTDSGKMILFKRSRILAGARQKIDILMSLLENYKDDKYILIYCGATTNINDETGEMNKQIDIVTQQLDKLLGIKVHKFTSEEDLNQRKMIKECFSDGLYQAITAIRCLDEGVNIPNIQTAFILSSSRNPKEFIQRRGRLLRKAEGKTKSVIYDFVTLPRNFNEIGFNDYEEDKTIIIGELVRVKEFGRLSCNKIKADNVIDEIQQVYGVSIDIEEELEKMEEEYNE